MVPGEDEGLDLSIAADISPSVAVEKEDGRNVAFKYVTVEKEYVAIEKEIQKHPHQAC